MAKREITHACGHKQTVELYGKYDDRDRREEYLQSQPCPACKAKQWLVDNNMKIINVHYGTYKESGYKQVYDTYDKKSKTIDMYVPMEAEGKNNIKEAMDVLKAMGVKEDDLKMMFELGFKYFKSFVEEGGAGSNEDHHKLMLKACEVLERYNID